MKTLQKYKILAVVCVSTALSILIESAIIGIGDKEPSVKRMLVIWLIASVPLWFTVNTSG